MPYAYAYALVKTRLYSHLRLSYYHSIIDSIDTRFIQYLSFYFSTSFPKIMFWLFTEVYKKIMSNDLRSKEMISPLRIHAVGLFQACSLFLTRKKKRKSCAFLLPSFWFTVFLFCHYCGVKRYFYDTGLKSKALWVLVAKHSCTFHTFSLTLRLDMVVLVFDLKWCALNSFQGNQNPWKVMGSLNSVYGELFKESISMIHVICGSHTASFCVQLVVCCSASCRSCFLTIL